MIRLGVFPRLVCPSLAAFVFALCSATYGRADSLAFNNPTGDLGSATHTYSLDGVNVVATGFNGGDLYGKNLGVTEQGVGLTSDPSGQHEIFAIVGAPQDFVQIDLLSLITAGFTDFMFQMGSTTSGETWQVTACSTAGVSGSGPCSVNGSTLTGTDESLDLVPANLSATDHYLDFSSNKGNMLLLQIEATAPVSTPDPGSFGLVLSGILLMAGFAARKQFRTSTA